MAIYWKPGNGVSGNSTNKHCSGKEGWMDDVSVYMDACGIYGVPAVLERSRSGNGGHIWIFFS